MSKCLLIIDMVNDYLDRLDEVERTRIVKATNELLASFRAAEFPVIWVRQEFEPDLSDAFPEMRAKAIAVTIKGTRGAELHTDLDHRLGDTTIIKKRYSAFFGTGLDMLLARSHVTQVVLCGINTHACIRVAAIDAYQRDLTVAIATDATTSYDLHHAQVSLDYMRDRIASLMTNDEVAAFVAL